MNYFVLIIFWFILCYFLNKSKKTNSNPKLLEFIIIFPLILMTAFRGKRYMADTSAYINIINSVPKNLNTLYNNLINTNTSEIGFDIIVSLLKNIYDNYIFVFFVIAAVQLILISLTYKKFSENYLLSIFLFVFSWDYFSICCNGMRQGIAISILFAITPFILKKNYILCIVFSLICFTIHSSALIFIPFIFLCNGEFLNKKTVLFIIFMIFAIYFFNNICNFLTNGFLNDKYTLNIKENLSTTRGMNFIRLFIFDWPLFIALFNLEKIKKTENKTINLFLNFSLVHFLFSILACFTSGIFLGRITWYFSLFNYILIPYELNHLLSSKIKTIVMFLIIILYLCYYMYQLNFSGILYIKQFGL